MQRLAQDSDLAERPLLVDVVQPDLRLDLLESGLLVRPELVAEVTFGEWTREGHPVPPSYTGLRADKAPIEVVRERQPWGQS